MGFLRNTTLTTVIEEYFGNCLQTTLFLVCD